MLYVISICAGQPCPSFEAIFSDGNFSPFFPFFVVLVVSKEIYVSRYHGNNQPSCGETMKTACKFIALGIAHAQWNDTIYIDGTETSRDPYPCLPTTSQLDGIYVNKSLSLRRFGKDKVFIRCSSLRRITLDGRNTSDKMIIYLDGIAFIDSSIAARMSSLYV